MSAGFVSRWAVRQSHTVSADDLDPTGAVRTEVLERWAEAACAEYLERCSTLTGRRVERKLRSLPSDGLPGRPTAVLVTASVTEVRPSSFTIRVRLRPRDTEDGRPADTACVVRLLDPPSEEASKAIRDELIAIEHAARHVS